MKKLVATLFILTTLILGLTIIPLFSYLGQVSGSEAQAYAIPMKSATQENYEKGTEFVNRLLRNDAKVYWLADPLKITTVNGSDYLLQRGDFIIPANQRIPKFGFSTSIPLSYIREKSMELNATVLEVSSPFEASVYPLKNLRVAVYYGGGCTGGTLEHIHPLEEAGFDVDVATQADIQHGNLYSYDVVTFPSGGPYLNYLNQTEINRIKDFVLRGGGFLGTCGGSVLGVQLGLLDAQMVKSDQEYLFAAMRGPIVLEKYSASPVTFGFENLFQSTYFWGPFINEVGNNVTVIATYHSSTPNLREYIQEIVEAYNLTINEVNIDDYWGKPAIIAGTYGAGKAVLSTVHPEVLPEAHRIFTNAIYFLSSGEKILIKNSISEKESSASGTYAGTAMAWNEAAYSQINDLVQTLEKRTLHAKLILNNFETANNEIIGATGEYLGSFISDTSSRCLQLSNALSELRDTYAELEELKSTIVGYVSTTPTVSAVRRNQLATIENLQGRIVSIFDFMTNLKESIYLMDVVGEEVSSEEQNLQQILSSNFSLTERYPKLINLQKMESQTLNKVKDLVDYYLLRWSFQARSMLIEADFLIYLCKASDNAFFATFTYPATCFLTKDAYTTKKIQAESSDESRL